MTICDRFAPDLVAYLDHELSGARQEFLEAHLQVCPICQARLQAMQRTRQLLRETTPPYDDPMARLRVKALIAQEASRPTRRWRTHSLLLTAALLVVLLGLVLRPAAQTEAGFPLGRLLRHLNSQGMPSLQSIQSPATPSASGVVGDGALAFPAIIPELLPGGLTLTDRSSNQPAILQLSYHGPNGLELRLTEMPEPQLRATIPDDARLTYVGDSEVLWQFDQHTQGVYHAFWLRKGVYFSIQVMESDTVGIPQERMSEIVAGVMAVQDGV